MSERFTALIPSATGGSTFDKTEGPLIAWSNVNQVGANLIGLNKEGTEAIPNQGAGVLVSGYARATGIGADAGIGPIEAGNHIAGNLGPGVEVLNSYDPSYAYVPGDKLGDGSLATSSEWGKHKVDLAAGATDWQANNISANVIGLGTNGEPVPNGTLGSAGWRLDYRLLRYADRGRIFAGGPEHHFRQQR